MITRRGLVLVLSFLTLRILIVFSERVGNFWSERALAPKDVEKAKEIHEAANARTAAVSAPALAFVTITTKLDGCAAGLDLVAYVLLIVAVVVAMSVLFLMKPKVFFGTRSVISVLVVATILDLCLGLTPDGTISRAFCAVVPTGK